MTTSSNTGPMTALINSASGSTTGSRSPLAGGSMSHDQNTEKLEFTHVYQQYMRVSSKDSSTGTGTVSTGTGTVDRPSSALPTLPLPGELDGVSFGAPHGIQLVDSNGLPVDIVPSDPALAESLSATDDHPFAPGVVLSDNELESDVLGINTIVNNQVNDESIVNYNVEIDSELVPSVPVAPLAQAVVDVQTGNSSGNNRPLSETGWPLSSSATASDRRTVMPGAAFTSDVPGAEEGLHQAAFKAASLSSTGPKLTPEAFPVAPGATLAPGLVTSTQDFSRSPSSKLAASIAPAATTTVQSLNTTAASAHLAEAASESLSAELSRFHTLSGLPDRPQVSSPVLTLPLSRFAGAPGWDQGLGQRMVWMIDQGLNQAELRLDPPQLGSVSVRISLADDQAHVTFQAQHPAAREALESALPKLREMFAERGLDLADADITQGDDQGGDAGDPSNAQSQSGRGVLTRENDLEMSNPSVATSTDARARASGTGVIDEFV